jgi:hypothetical protein
LQICEGGIPPSNSQTSTESTHPWQSQTQLTRTHDCTGSTIHLKPTIYNEYTPNPTTTTHDYIGPTSHLKLTIYNGYILIISKGYTGREKKKKLKNHDCWRKKRLK